MKAGWARFSVLLCGLLVVGLSVATLARAAWTTPVNLSHAGHDAVSVEVAVNADGDAVFTWTRFDGEHYRVQARAQSAAGALSAVQTLSRAGEDVFEPEVAVDADGDAVFTWRRLDGADYRVQARARSAGGVLSAVQTLSAAGQDAFAPQVAVDADGDAVFTWWRSDGASYRVQARARSAGGALSAVQTLSGSNARYPEVAVDADGDAVFTWYRFDGRNLRVQARARSAAGALSAVQTLSETGQNAWDPEVAVNADGDAVFTWTRFDGEDYRVQARARSAAGALSAVQTLSGAGQSAELPQVAVDADGDAVFTWMRFHGSNNRAQARALSAGGALSTVQTLSLAGQDASSPQVAVDADGDAVFTWDRSDGAYNRVQARARSAAGALSAVQTLSGAGEGAAYEPRVGVDADGDALVAWYRFDGTDWRIQGSAGP